ncbi:hypothetical protein CXG81DRAFT_24906 [Caulochytrium protostelioides]|uniref:STI1/HOP DP domain-containing protein n=1 Tax=Caulochytrium protostelioides TaxID=1555241 RepID=A0A4P9XAT0_9FUNG|nr:hypothetical protein CXG81DRAFT_24906 [Caulochytrium protostelioides]|eukprot:RKP02445.1 hypothetical protein CXG81DRAFT_24906 [Caulochytrium protostelioides]
MVLVAPSPPASGADLVATAADVLDDMPPPLEDCTALLATLALHPPPPPLAAAAAPATVPAMTTTTSATAAAATTPAAAIDAVPPPRRRTVDTSLADDAVADAPPAVGRVPGLASDSRRSAPPAATGRSLIVPLDGRDAAAAAAAAPATVPPAPAPSGLKRGFFNRPARRAAPAAPPAAAASKPAAKPAPAAAPAATTARLDHLKALPLSDDQRGASGAAGSPPWLTPAFLEQVAQHPALAQALTEPDFQRACAEMRHGRPEATLVAWPQYHTALRQLAGLLGDAFSALGDAADTARRPSGSATATTTATTATATTTVSAPVVPSDLPQHEQQLVQRVLANPALQAALKDPAIQQLLAAARRQPSVLSQALRHGSRQVQQQVRLLIDAGFISVQ